MISALDSQREANCDVILFDQNTNNPQAGENVGHIGDDQGLKPKKNRKKLSGHLSKVYALQWKEDSR